MTLFVNNKCIQFDTLNITENIWLPWTSLNAQDIREYCFLDKEHSNNVGYFMLLQ